MQIVPAEHAIDRCHPPWEILFLIFVNCLVYYSIRAGDVERHAEAEDLHHEEWRRDRDRYDALLAKVISHEYAFDVARRVTYATSMFLHGGFHHLLGNMVSCSSRGSWSSVSAATAGTWPDT